MVIKAVMITMMMMMIPMMPYSTSIHLKVCMLLDVIGPHPVEDEVCLIGNPHNVIPRGMGKQSDKSYY